MARAIEKRIRTELEKLLEAEREKYEAFFDAFGLQIKYGLYADYGVHKDELKDLVLLRTGKEGKYTTLKEYVSRMPEGQKAIYYASGETVDRIGLLPQVEAVEDRGFEVLYLTDDIDEFALRILDEYEGKKFANVCTEQLDITTEEEKAHIKQKNEDASALLAFMKQTLGEAVQSVRLTSTLKNHPVSLASEGGLSVEMEKVLNKMPGAQGAKATLVLEINAAHAVADKLLALYETDRDRVADYTKILYAQARLISGLSVEDPAELSDLICSLM
jgi:molecular chaperone HtpG